VRELEGVANEVTRLPEASPERAALTLDPLAWRHELLERRLVEVCAVADPPVGTKPSIPVTCTIKAPATWRGWRAAWARCERVSGMSS